MADEPCVCNIGLPCMADERDEPKDPLHRPTRYLPPVRLAPVDVPGRIRAAAHAAFTAMDKGVLMSETGDGAESVLAVGHLHLIAEYLERHPDWPSAQAIVRALATPTTETTAQEG